LKFYGAAQLEDIKSPVVVEQDGLERNVALLVVQGNAALREIVTVTLAAQRNPVCTDKNSVGFDACCARQDSSFATGNPLAGNRVSLEVYCFGEGRTWDD